MSLLPYHKGNKTNFINLLFTLTRVLQAGFSNVFITFVRIAVISGRQNRSWRRLEYD